MVSYQAFVSLVYDETPDGSIESADENSEFMSSIGQYWTNNSEDLKPMTQAQARERIREDLQA